MMAAVNNGSTMEEIEAGLDATFGSFMSTRLDMRLAGTWADFDRDSAKTGPLATYVHEHMHFFQTIFTGYGHVQWSSHRQMTGFLVSQWHRLVPKMEGKVRLPLAGCAVSPQLEATARWLYETSMEQIRLGQARFFMRYGTLTLKEWGSVVLAKDWIANPVIEIAGKQRAFQTKDILEGHAHFVERTFLEFVAKVDHDIAWSRDGLPDQYTAAYDWFIQECGEERREDFPAVCDLAMQIMWNPVIPTNEKEWRSSNPSWRFLELARALAANPGLSLGPAERWPETYMGFCAQLLNICKFPQLTEVFEARLSELERPRELTGIQKLMKEAVEFRQSKPWSAINPARDVELLYELFDKFKAPFVVVGEAMGTFGRPAHAGEVVFELQYQAFAAQILGDFSPEARETRTIECAFGKYRISRGCEFQSSHGCPGRFSPPDGVPHPKTQTAEGTLGGCSFGWLLSTMGVESKDIVIDFDAKFSPLKRK